VARRSCRPRPIAAERLVPKPRPSPFPAARPASWPGPRPHTGPLGVNHRRRVAYTAGGGGMFGALAGPAGCGATAAAGSTAEHDQESPASPGRSRTRVKCSAANSAPMVISVTAPRMAADGRMAIAVSMGPPPFPANRLKQQVGPAAGSAAPARSAPRTRSPAGSSVCNSSRTPRDNERGPGPPEPGSGPAPQVHQAGVFIHRFASAAP